MTSPEVRVVLNEAAILGQRGEPYMRAAAQARGDEIARAAAAGAPKRTGAGAGSIHAETVLGPDGWEARVSWDTAHDYMRYQDEGTSEIPAQHFLEAAAGAGGGGGRGGGGRRRRVAVPQGGRTRSAASGRSRRSGVAARERKNAMTTAVRKIRRRDLEWASPKKRAAQHALTGNYLMPNARSAKSRAARRAVNVYGAGPRTTKTTFTGKRMRI